MLKIGSRGRVLIVAAFLIAATGISLAQEPRQLPGLPDWAWEKCQAIDAGQNPEVVEWARQRLRQVEAEHGPNSLEVAEVLDVLAFGLIRTDLEGRAEAKRLADRALTIKESRLSPEALELVPTLLIGAFEASNPQRLLRALAIAERHLGLNDLRLVPVLDYLETYNQTFGSLRQARMYQDRELEIVEAELGSDDIETVERRYEVARWAGFGYDFDRAETLFTDVLEHFKEMEGERSYWYAAALHARGNSRLNEGRYVEARQDIERALEIRLELDPPNPWDTGASYNSLGIFHESLLDLDAAREAFAKAADLWVGASNRPYIQEPALPLANLAEVLVRIGEYDEAGDALDRAFAFLQRSPRWTEHLYYPRLAEISGRLFERTGDTEQARQRLRAAIAGYERQWGPGYPRIAELLLLLAKMDLEGGEFGRARERLDRALRIQESTVGPEHPAVVETLEWQARLEALEGHPAVALERALRAATVARSHLRQTARGLPERQALRYGKQLAEMLDLTLDLAAQSPATTPWPDIYDEIVHSRAVVLDEMAVRHRDLGASDSPEVADLLGGLERAQARLAALTLGEPTGGIVEGYLDSVKSLRVEKERLENRLARLSKEFRERKRETEVGVEEVFDATPPDAALVSYVRGGGAAGWYGAIVAAHERSPRFVRLGSIAEIDALIENWRVEAAKRPPARGTRGVEAEKAYRTVAKRLRRAIWDPVAPWLGGAKLVFVVPEGRLHTVSLATLADEDGSYIVESGPTIHYLSAERDIATLAKRTRTGTSSLLAFGGPDYDALPGAAGEQTGSSTGPVVYRGATSSCSQFRSTRFTPLPLAETEAREVAAIWEAGSRTAEVFTGGAARETVFRRDAPAYGLVHLATHGFVLEQGCSGPREDNPMLDTGLVFAAANHRAEADPARQDDGILTAEEIATLDLGATDWVVLSACSTGIGHVERGEGVLGLRRAFQVAGASTLITSLWDVSDDAARDWMVELYRARAARLTTADAMRRASRRRLTLERESLGHGHPFFWGGFVAAGDWR